MKHSKSTPYKRPEISLPPYHRLDRSKSETDELLRTSMSEGSNGGRSKSSSSKQGSSTSDIAIHAKKSQSLGSTKTPNEMLGKAGSSFTRDLLSEYMKKFPGICYTAGEALLVGGPYAPPAASTYMTVAGSLALTAGGATQLATTLHKICKVRRARRAELAAVKEQSKNVSPRLGNKSLQRLSAPSTSNRSGDLSSKSHFDPFSSTNSFSSQSKAQGVSVSKSIVGKSHRTKSLDLDLLEQGQLHQNQPKDSRASSTDIPEQEVSLTKAQLKRQYRQENWNKVCKVLKDPRMYARVLESAGGAAILASVQSGSTCPSDNSSNNSTWLTQWPVVAGIGARVAGKIVINGVDATEKARKKHNERIGKSAKGDNPEKDAEGRHSPKSSEGAGLMGEGFDFA
ncbi:hypothetical protein MMC10_003779 [Thelotrema lepadinum]|nr:hypothetical protein [Thelotrema lepadinum]